MRFFSLLVDLIGFAGLIVASPTPIRPAVDARAPSPKSLVIYAQDNFQGQGYEIHAFNRCFTLDSPLYKNIHSYHVTDMVCNFMGTDKCDENTLVTTDARGADVWGYVDPAGAEKFSDKITSVYCGDRALVSGATTDAGLNRREEDNNLYALGGAGETNICMGTDIMCVTLSANGACVTIPGPIAQSVRSIHQSPGAVCKYYNKDCQRELISVNSKSGWMNMWVTFDVGDHISTVECNGGWLTDTENTALEARTNDIASSWPGHVHATTKFNGSPGSVGMDALGHCHRFPDGFGMNTDAIMQSEGAYCTYYSTFYCAWGSVVLRVDSRRSDTYPYLGPASVIGHQIAGVHCIVPGRGSQTGVTTYPASPTSEEESRSFSGERRAADLQTSSTALGAMDTSMGTDYSGYIMFCKHPFGCSNFVALNACREFEKQFNHGLDTVWQEKGAVCKYFRFDCSEVKPVFVVDSRNGNYNGDLDGYGHDVGLVLCRTDWPNEQRSSGPNTIVVDAANSAVKPKRRSTIDGISTRSENVEAPALDHPPGEVTVCSEPDWLGVCDTFNAMGRCIAIPQETTWRHVRSIVQAKGAFCGYYGGQKDCTDMRLYLLSKGGEASVANTNDPVGITRVFCGVSRESIPGNDTAIAPPPTE
ncbi:hypothetical protein CC86DRAFT_471920 [Ophiobolus disseminans]|uniref:Ecp2 effector protein domain-containing protein n=1 Tax=Ophiobolus disseminans TaxID=1469910 RepID=A0A6A6ZGH9_9PLEO|nr:hypothetical protein CC86DRAFT_471920 [Ophiobolus disseminans]